MTIDELEALAVAWTPPQGAFAASPAGRFAARHGIADARSLGERAAADPAWYWAAGWRTWVSRGCAPTTPSSISRGGSSTPTSSSEGC